MFSAPGWTLVRGSRMANPARSSTRADAEPTGWFLLPEWNPQIHSQIVYDSVNHDEEARASDD